MYTYICTNTGSDATVLAGKELGVKTLAYYPLAMGLLTGKLLPQRFRGKGDPRCVGGWVRGWVGGNGWVLGLVRWGSVGGFVSNYTSSLIFYMYKHGDTHV